MDEPEKPEMKALMNFRTVTVVKDEGQDFVTSKCILREKQDHYRMKKNMKAQIVAWGLQEDLDVQNKKYKCKTNR